MGVAVNRCLKHRCEVPHGVCSRAVFLSDGMPGIGPQALHGYGSVVYDSEGWKRAGAGR